MAELQKVVPLVATQSSTPPSWDTLLEYVSPARYATLSKKSEAYKALFQAALTAPPTEKGHAVARLLIVADLFERDGALQLDEPVVKHYMTQVLVKEKQLVSKEVQALTQDTMHTFCDMLEAEGLLEASRAYTLIPKEGTEDKVPRLRVERIGYLDQSVKVPNRESRTVLYEYRFGETLEMERIKHGGYGNHWERGHREIKDQLYGYRKVHYLAKHYDWLLSFLEHLGDFTVEVFDTIDRDIDDHRIANKAQFEEGIKQKLLDIVANDVLHETE